MARLRKPAMRYWYVYAICLGLWLTGALWLVFHYFLMRPGDFGRAPHPLEHWWLISHGASAFASLWLMGFLWGTHVVQRWRHRRHRKTGGTLFTIMLMLVVSGYLLYYLSNDDWRASTAVVHWVIGLAMPLSLFAHWWIRRR